MGKHKCVGKDRGRYYEPVIKDSDREFKARAGLRFDVCIHSDPAKVIAEYLVLRQQWRAEEATAAP